MRTITIEPIDFSADERKLAEPWRFRSSTRSPNGVEALMIEFWRDGNFKYAARVEVYLKGKRLAKLTAAMNTARQAACAFEKVPVKKSGDTWSVGLTQEDAARAVWIKPRHAMTVRFTEGTRSGLLRHAGLVSLDSE